MPRIDFVCNDCGDSFVKYVKFSDRDKVQCPACDGRNVKQDFLGKWNTGSSGSSSGASGSTVPVSSGFS
jgi:putative FmdB family regulatory protein